MRLRRFVSSSFFLALVTVSLGSPAVEEIERLSPETFTRQICCSRSSVHLDLLRIQGSYIGRAGQEILLQD